MVLSPGTTLYRPSPSALVVAESERACWRLESESNRRSRSCSPLHDHSAIQPDEVAFEKDVFLLTKAAARAQNAEPEIELEPPPAPAPVQPTPAPTPPEAPQSGQTTLRLSGTIPSEVWNLIGHKVLPKLRQGEALTIGIDFSVQVNAALAESTAADLEQALGDLGIRDAVRIERC